MDSHLQMMNLTAHTFRNTTRFILSLPLDHGAAFHTFTHRVPVHQPGLQLPCPLRQLQQRHLLPQSLQRVGSFGHRATCRWPPTPPAASTHHPAKLCLQQLRRAGPQREQDPAPLQCVREEQPQAGPTAPQSLHPPTDGPPGPAT